MGDYAVLKQSCARYDPNCSSLFSQDPSEETFTVQGNPIFGQSCNRPNSFFVQFQWGSPNLSECCLQNFAEEFLLLCRQFLSLRSQVEHIDGFLSLRINERHVDVAS
jgi:hypothetical protein